MFDVGMMLEGEIWWKNAPKIVLEAGNFEVRVLGI